MRILFLTKRRPQQRDLLTRPYGRFFHLPKYLVAQGHTVGLLLLSYRSDPAEQREMEGIEVMTESLRPWGLSPYFQRAGEWMNRERTDWIVGCSDTWFGLMALRLGRTHGARVLLDAYDNYESYLPWLKPLHWAWRRALRRADAVTGAGPRLAERLAGSRGQVVPMAADPIFRPLDRDACRKQLKLPLDRPLMGYSGAIHGSRNIDLLPRVFQRARQRVPKLELVLTGRGSEGMAFPEGTRRLGYLPDEDMPVLMNSLDAMAVVNRASAFGHHSYPSKLYEAMRCEVPVVASRTDSVGWILQNHPECLANDEAEFSNRLVHALTTGSGEKRYRLPHANDWNASGAALSRILGQ